MTNIRNHVDARHRDEDKSYVCEECNSEYKTLNSMRAHRSRVHGRKRKMEEERRRGERELVEEKRQKGSSNCNRTKDRRPFPNLKGAGDT